MFSDGYSNFIQCRLNLSAETYQSGLQFGLPNFLTPQKPLDPVKISWVLIFPSDVAPYNF